MALHSQFVVGVYLHAQVLTRVDELDQQRKLVAETLIDLLSHQQAFVLVDELCEVQPHIHIIDESTFHGHTFMASHAADFPALAYIGLCRVDALERGNLVASPNSSLQIRFKLVWFHITFNFQLKTHVKHSPPIVVSRCLPT